MSRLFVALVVLLVFWYASRGSGFAVSYPPEDLSDRYRLAGDRASVIPHPWAPSSKK
jgi:hypothetical protein